jgi:L-fuconolactonase
VIVDAHHHLWDPTTADYPWMTDEMTTIRRRFDTEDLEPLLREHLVAGTVVVQARTSLDETRSLLSRAAETPFLLGVVGWVDLTDPLLPAVLAALASPHLVGVRHQVEDEPDPRWLLRSDVLRGLDAIGAVGLAYDLLVRPRELPVALDVARRLPHVRFVIDHVAKPTLGSAPDDEWARGLAAIAALPNSTCKLSGLVTEAPLGVLQRDELVEILRRALDWFGPHRCLYGSDWPVCLLAAEYGEVFEILQAAIADLTPEEQAAVLGETAINTYRLDVTDLRARTFS